VEKGLRRQNKGPKLLALRGEEQEPTVRIREDGGVRLELPTGTANRGRGEQQGGGDKQGLREARRIERARGRRWEIKKIEGSSTQRKTKIEKKGSLEHLGGGPGGGKACCRPLA